MWTGATGLVCTQRDACLMWRVFDDWCVRSSRTFFKNTGEDAIGSGIRMRHGAASTQTRGTRLVLHDKEGMQLIQEYT